MADGLDGKRTGLSVTTPAPRYERTNQPTKLMQQLMQSFLILFLTALTLPNLHAQTAGGGGNDYRTAVGLRLGYPLSVSLKQKLNDSHAVELFAGTTGSRHFGSSYRWFQVGGAYQIHQPLGIDGVDGLNWYYGAGVSAWIFSSRDAFFDDSWSSTSLAVQGYVGLEYTLPNAPVNFSVDWVPTYRFGGWGYGFGAGYGAVAVRYVLK